VDNKKLMDEETKKLTSVVVILSVFVIVLFGLGPLI